MKGVSILSLLVFSTAFFIISCSSQKTVRSTKSSNAKENKVQKPIELTDDFDPRLIYQSLGEDERKQQYFTAKELLANKCGSCHKVYRPKELNWTSWNALLLTESRKAGLNQNEYQTLKTWIFSQTN